MNKVMELMYDNFNEVLETEAVTAAEAETKELYDRLMKIDSGLAMAFDDAVSLIARAYEKNGFCGGFKYGKEAAV